jgi:hypothetical protein
MFYFNFNPNCAEWDEIIGLHIIRLYIGLIDKSIVAAITNSGGGITNKNRIKIRILR